ncbi:MAG: signal recognition particle protein [Deltaproteobacteria bacterium]|nr:signal recognition particle protein [Deltaproteobacteria bacterium]
MFDNLSEKFDAVFKKLRGRGILSDEVLRETLREIRLVLLEADVNLKVVKAFIESVREKASGQEVMKSLTPSQQVIKIVRDELARLMGEGGDNRLQLGGPPPAGIMLCGLQGVGKTTTCGKLALRLRKEKRRPLLVPADVYRPAAIQQLKTVGRQIGIEVFEAGQTANPVTICQEAMRFGALNGFDTVIMDTAGRLHVDEALMDELVRIKETVSPREILFVADAMTGQDAVTFAGIFNERLDVTGTILTKMDGDARGGAALSILSVTGKPIKFVGLGEKLEALEVFHPDRMAQRILGMGDVLSLIEKAEASVDRESAVATGQKLMKEGLTLELFRDQLRNIKKMGPMDSLIKMLPGADKMMRQMEGDGAQIAEKELKRIEAIIDSMTLEERRDHRILNGSRRLRIAKGSGTTVQDINQLIKRFTEMQNMMKKFQGMGPKKLKNLIRGLR